MVIDKIPCHDATLLIGYLNAKIGIKLEDGLVGRHGVQSEGGKFISCCGLNNLAIITTMLPHKDIHLHTWTSPNN